MDDARCAAGLSPSQAPSRRTEKGAVQRTLIDAIKQKLETTGVPDLAPIQIARTLPPDSDPMRLIEA